MFSQGNNCFIHKALFQLTVRLRRETPVTNIINIIISTSPNNQIIFIEKHFILVFLLSLFFQHYSVVLYLLATIS
jgi:hypothetical protein